MNWEKAVTKFHQTYKQNVNNPHNTSVSLRFNLILEELTELLEAYLLPEQLTEWEEVKASLLEAMEGMTGDQGDPVEVADALADLMYVTQGFAVELGLPLNKVGQEVQASNMSKLGEDGNPIFREDGKVQKGPNYFEPNIVKILDEHNCLWDNMPES